MRLLVRHVAGDGMSLKSEAILQAKNPMAGAKVFADRHYVARGERIDVMMLVGDAILNYEVRQSRIDEGGCRVKYIGKNASP